jgi:hypothetical protein
MGRDGEVLAVNWTGIFRITEDGTVVGPVRPLPPDPQFAPNFAGDIYRIAYDEWNDEVLVAPVMISFGANTWSAPVYGPGPWRQVFNSGLFRIDSLHITGEKPFEVFGAGCANATGLDPRLGWQGLPIRGSSFVIKLRQAESNGLAVFWLGASDTSWLSLALPWEAGPLGAQGCRLRVSPDALFAAPVDGNGGATLPVAVPANASLAGLEVFAQSASTSAANALGFAASDALAIRVR